MAKKTNAKREARIEKNNRNLNNALTLFTIGFFTEFYLLMVNRYYVKGSVNQLLAVYNFLKAIVYVGCVLVAAGIVLLVMKEKWPRAVSYSPWLMGFGVFLVLSSELMMKVYPGGTTAMCILVPVGMLLSVVYLLYPREFAIQSTALTVAIGCAVLVGRHMATAILAVLATVGAYAALVLLLAALVALIVAKGHGGKLGKLELLGAGSDDVLTIAVLGISAAIIALSLFAGVAYYAIWAGAAVLFALAVWYTVKMM